MIESVLDSLDLDPSASLSDLAEQLRELAAAGDAATRERARRAFERLTEQPRAHFLEVWRAMPRDPVHLAPRPAVTAISIALADVIDETLEGRLPPLDDRERALEEAMPPSLRRPPA